MTTTNSTNASRNRKRTFPKSAEAMPRKAASASAPSLSNYEAMKAAAAIGRCLCGSYMGVTLTAAPNGSLYASEACSKVLAGGACAASWNAVSRRRVTQARPSGNQAVDTRALGLAIEVPLSRRSLRDFVQAFVGVFSAGAAVARRFLGRVFARAGAASR